MMRKRFCCIFMALALCIASIVPCTESSAADAERELEAKNLAPNLNYTFTSIKETPVSTAAGSSKATILIFGKTTCGYTIETMQGISGSSWVKDSSIRIIFAEASTKSKAEVEAFSNRYGCSAITFCYDNGYGINNALWNYVNAGSISDEDAYYPFIVLIDSRNMIQKVTTGRKSEKEIITEVNRFKDSVKPSAPDNSAAKPTAPKPGSVVTDLRTKSVCKVISTGNAGGTAEYVRPSNKRSTSAKVPATVVISGRMYAVTSIAPNAFKGNKKLKSVTIEKNVRKIGKNAFYGCKNLRKIVIKSKNLSKKSVGKNAFRGIYSKATIRVPKNKVKSYKSVFRSKGMGKKAKVKKL